MSKIDFVLSLKRKFLPKLHQVRWNCLFFLNFLKKKIYF